MSRSSSIFVWFGLIIAASLALYHTSDRVHELNQKLAELNGSIDAERQSIHVLKADWVYLTNPDRISKIAKRHLAVRPSTPSQMMAMGEVNQMLPTRNDALASVSVTGTPIASVRSTLSPSMRPTTVAMRTPAAKPTGVAVIKRSTQVASAQNTLDKPVEKPAVQQVRSRDHMIMQQTASAAPVGDSIGSIIAGLDQHQ